MQRFLAQRRDFFSTTAMVLGGFLLALLAFLAMYKPASSALLTQSAKESESSLATWLPAPKTINKLVNVSDTVVIGTVSRFIEKRVDGPLGAPSLDPRPGAPQPKGIAYSYYEIRIERALVDDGNVKIHPIIRVKGYAGDGLDVNRRIQLPEMGTKYIFFLSSVDVQRYGLRGPWAMIRLDGDKVVSSDPARTQPKFATNMEPVEFIRLVEQAAATRTREKPNMPTFEDAPGHRSRN